MNKPPLKPTSLINYEKKCISMIKITKIFAFQNKVLQYLYMLDQLNKTFKYLLYIRLKGKVQPLRVFFYWVKLDVPFPRESSNPENEINTNLSAIIEDPTGIKGAFNGLLLPRYVPVRSTRIERIGTGLRRQYKRSPIGC